MSDLCRFYSSLFFRWNSLSNDEMMKIREDRYLYEPNLLTFHQLNAARPPPSTILPKSNLVQMANITVMPQSEIIEPRKFSKYNPQRKRRSRSSNEELIYIRQNFPPERYLYTSWVDFYARARGSRHQGEYVLVGIVVVVVVLFSPIC